ncbi:MAG: TROVE domain-containing protein [Clostridia bacterium]|nr:TROVE domain-containing protein [Clostridia bacterium]
MAKFNQKNTNKTVNHDNFPAYRMDLKERLVTAVLTTMFGEPKFYGSTDTDVVRLATRCAAAAPAFLCRLTCYARNDNNLRSVSHVLCCVIAREAHEYTRLTVRNIVIRPDDMTEILSCYKQMYGKPFPNALKREMAQVIQSFDEYQLAKYKGNGALKLRDVLRITHPVPKDAQTEALFRKVLDDTLQTPYTWETELSAKGNTKAVWNELIASGKVGYMALLRNLRNIVKCGANVQPVLNILADPERVKKSRQLPFRFYSAYLTLTNEKLMTDNIHRALEKALEASVGNMEQIPGRTLIAVDVSGSMGSRISAKSDVRCCDIASLLGAMASRLCEDAAVCYFDCAAYSWSSNGGKGYTVKHYGKYDSILEICKNSRFYGGGTQMDLPMVFALQEDGSRSIKPFDRVIYFSDNECNSSHNGMNKTVQGMVDEYRAKYNPNFWVHGVDMQGYGTQQFCGKGYNLIAGWSESVLPFINLAEKGIGSLVDTIEKYPVNS